MIRFFKLFLLAAVSAALPLGASGAEVSVAVSPSTVAAGEQVTFSLTMDKRLTEGLRLPPLENGRWITNSVSQRMESINFNTSYTYEIPIQTEREGTLKIPSFTFRLDGQEVTTRALKVLPPGSQPAVQSSGDSVTMKEAAFGTIRIPDERRTFYVGEEIPLELNLWLLPALRARLAEYPDLTGLDNVVFRDYSRNNPQMRRFDRPQERRELLDGRYYGVLTFRTAFRATLPGKLTPGANATGKTAAGHAAPALRSTTISSTPSLPGKTAFPTGSPLLRGRRSPSKHFPLPRQTASTSGWSATGRSAAALTRTPARWGNRSR